MLAEKSITIDIIDVDDGNLPEDLLDLNPYNSVPTLVDRDLVLYDSRVIMEYLDERFPHPPLMPVDPVTRAQFRLALYRIERDWYSLAEEIGTRRRPQAAGPRREGARGKHPVERRDLRREEVLLERRVLARRLHDRADPLATAAVRHQAAAPLRADPALHGRGVLAALVPGEPDRVRAGDTPVASTPTKQRPYLLRAMHEWMVDNGFTPHLVVDARRDGVRRSERARARRQDLLNVSASATRALALGNELVTFEARFGGVPRQLEIPVAAVLGIYARETGQGMMFGDDDPAPPPGRAVAAAARAVTRPGGGSQPPSRQAEAQSHQVTRARGAPERELRPLRLADARVASARLEQLRVDQVAEAVDHEQVHLLDPARALRRHADLDVVRPRARPRSRRRRGP